MSKQFIAKVNLEVTVELDVDDNVSRRNIEQSATLRALAFDVQARLAGAQTHTVKVEQGDMQVRQVFVSSFDPTPKDMATKVPTDDQVEDILVTPDQRDMLNAFLDGVTAKNMATYEQRVDAALRLARSCCTEHVGFDCCDFMLLLSFGQHLNNQAEIRAMNTAFNL